MTVSPRGEELAALNGAGALAAAREYVALGWPVLPIAGMVGPSCGCRARSACEHPAKHPLNRGGTKTASTDVAQVAEWWDHWPWAGVGIVTGVRSGLVVLDVDPRHGGTHSLEELRERGLELTRTLYAHTGGNGWHLYYGHPGFEVHNTTGRVGARQLGGLDMRGDGGFVVAPPSGHVDGGCYRWSSSAGAVEVIPSWMTQRADPARATSPRVEHLDRVIKYASTALEGECRRVAAAPEGLRNETLNRAAFALGTLVSTGALSAEAVVESLARAAAVASEQGVKPLGPLDAMRTIRSGLAAGMQRPRSLGGPGAPDRPVPAPTQRQPPPARLAHRL